MRLHLSIIFVLASLQSLTGALLPPSRFAVSSACVQPADLSGCLLSASNQTSSGLTSNLDTTLTGKTPSSSTVTADVKGSANANYGVLKGFASLNLQTNPADYQIVASSVSSAQFTDVVTVDFAPFTGQIGFLEAGYPLDSGRRSR